MDHRTLQCFLDHESTALGKTAGKDAANEKPTFPAILGMDASRRRLLQLTDQAVAAVAALGEDSRDLVALARYVAERDS